jgi:hypothetical protein
LTERDGIVALMCNDMKVVGHDDKPAAKPIVTIRAVEEERYQALERLFVVQNTFPSAYAQCEEIRNVAVTIGPDAMQSAQAAGWSCARDATWGHVAYIRRCCVVGRVP